MGAFLNTPIPFKEYRDITTTRFFVDKSMLIDEILSSLELDGLKYLCITRPRRFGKSTMANMIASFLGKSVDASEVFDNLAIAETEKYQKHLNKHDIIYIDFSRRERKCTSYEQYIDSILNDLNTDLAEAYPEIKIDVSGTTWKILSEIFRKTGHTFIFVMDEWDWVFHRSFITKDNQKDYLDFLTSLLKGQPYVELAYMTGILPIAKYCGGSELNMFLEFDMVITKRFSKHFGFLDIEVDKLYDIYISTTEEPEISREDLTMWYNGYHTATGERLYNPRSIVSALGTNQIRSYWTESGPYDEISFYIKNNVDAVRDDLVRMVTGERIKVNIQEYAATAKELKTREQIYSAMVVYGLLTYEAGKVFIPNKELMIKFRKLLIENQSLGYVYKLAKESERMVKATLEEDTQTMEEILKFAHDTEVPAKYYNNERDLSFVIHLIYLSAYDDYHVETELKTGGGYADFMFFPERKGEDAFILELKVDSTPEEAIAQIKDRDYALRFKGKLGEESPYTGRILAVGISYDRKTKEHFCKVEVL